MAIISAFTYVYRGPLQTLLARFENVYRPCQNPIDYKIGSFDSRFGIAKDYFLNALREAETIWEKPIGHELFAYAPTGNLKVNLIYDYRQQATAQLQKLGLTVNDDEASYNALRTKYNALQATYAIDKTVFETKISDYEARKKTYGNAARAELNQLQIQLNEEVDNINALVLVLNRLAETLNLQVSQFNTIGKSRGTEFEEGNYQSGPNGQQIDIYEFENRGKLVRVLAHELGHALGLEHIDNPKAIMYRLNNGINGKLTATDLGALKKLCGIK